jgi:hypothetical protein
MPININGENISNEEAGRILKTLYNDAKQIAGEFHGMERSAKFRVNWPDENKFAESEWKNFVEAAIQIYVAKLADPKATPEEKRFCHLAIVLNAKMAEGREKDQRLQIAPNTQQFVGDKYENKKILEKFGTKPNYRAMLKNTAADLLTKH